ncbi:MAG: PAS domain-containing protein [Hoeflea sp.]|uniref:PAS domain-containing protein n=1 Tax=Hoeflea sp. TaxID=1940281 RepID=UPI001D24333F|nr:PAS domain-containing protein [Hoeflea sp.]MBU4531097.1 PAS domain-containing protein [Alphaproteobacteria bacterium]MBU4542872.1 PAS domain-containing protein [Alphaproteobacteria bacterium]MBU4552684.1 PAS domain-containing protein [Alphaproteobacteria bacterium]MBV1722989.1 PAS domain-containing protein [Hoeflea sp.]MBV1762900.1 PAS domain-containing protein [Hoeflea sp.]
MLSGLIQQFERLANELVAAAYHEDEARVDRIDARIQELIDRLFRMRVHSRNDISAQIGFFKRLAERNCEDGSSVRRYTDAMTALFERYMDLNAGLVPRDDGLMVLPLQEGYDPSVQEMALDCLQERVAIIGLDYRYIYCNKRNADFHEKRPSDFIGRHLSEMIDMKRFQTRAKPRLDQCFDGACISYDYEIADAGGQMFDVNCRMTPFPGADGTIIGAVLILSMQSMFARVS